MGLGAENEIFLKNMLTPCIIGLIGNMNEREFKKYNCKVIIAGGEALRKYVNDPALETHDFDLRIIHEPYPKMDDKETINKMEMIQEKFAKVMTDYLNAVFDDRSIPFQPQYARSFPGVPLIRDKFNKVFVVETRPKQLFGCKLISVNYAYKEQEVVVAPLIDIVVFTILRAEHLATENQVMIPTEPYVVDLPSEPDKKAAMRLSSFTRNKNPPNTRWGQVVSRNGITNSLMSYTQFFPGVYYTSFGYCIWDTVRMLNFLTDKSFQDRKPHVKFERYISKYVAILNSLSTFNNLNCSSFKQLTDRCSKTKSTCVLPNNRGTTDFRELRGFYGTEGLAAKFGVIPYASFEEYCNGLGGKVVV